MNRLKVTSAAYSPRIEPGAASSGFVAPISCRAAATASRPSSTAATRGPGDELDQLAEERLLRVLGVVAAGEVLVDPQLPQGDDPQALALKPPQDLAGQPPLKGVGLDQDEGSRCLSHEAERLSVSGDAPIPSTDALGPMRRPGTLVSLYVHSTFKS
jgi:hypothetical protein